MVLPLISSLLFSSLISLSLPLSLFSPLLRRRLPFCLSSSFSNFDSFFFPSSYYFLSFALNYQLSFSKEKDFIAIMNSLVATPPVPPHFYEHARLSPSRSSKFVFGQRQCKSKIMKQMNFPFFWGLEEDVLLTCFVFSFSSSYSVIHKCY